MATTSLFVIGGSFHLGLAGCGAAAAALKIASLLAAVPPIVGTLLCTHLPAWLARQLQLPAGLAAATALLALFSGLARGQMAVQRGAWAFFVALT